MYISQHTTSIISKMDRLSIIEYVCSLKLCLGKKVYLTRERERERDGKTESVDNKFAYGYTFTFHLLIVHIGDTSDRSN